MNLQKTLDATIRQPSARSILRVVLAVFMIVAGALHFQATDAYMAIMPSYLPYHRELVFVSGAFEILGGIGLLIPKLRVAAGIGLIVLFFAVLPANINMAIFDLQPASFHIPAALLWARIPFQLVIVCWAWFVLLPNPVPGTPSE